MLVLKVLFLLLITILGIIQIGNHKNHPVSDLYCGTEGNFTVKEISDSNSTSAELHTMSSSIRQFMGPAKRRLNDHMQKAQGLINDIRATNQSNEVLEDIKLQVKFIENSVQKIETRDKEWAEVIAKLDPEKCDEELKLYNQFSDGDDGYLEVILKAQDILMELEVLSDRFGPPPVSSVLFPNPVALTKEMASVKLPKLSMPAFDGDVTKWREFWDVYESSIHSQNLPDVQKFSYLISCLHGEAKGEIAGFAVTNENYTEAIELLKDRFGNVESIKSALDKDLRMMRPCNKDVSSMRQKLSQIEQIVRQMQALGKNVSHFADVILEKFPYEVAVDLNSMRNIREPWDVEELRKGLRNYLAVREASQRKCQNGERPETFPVGSSPIYTADALVSQARNVTLRSRTPCVFCGGSHYNTDCPVYINPKQRRDKLWEMRRCYLCLGQNHIARQCVANVKPCYYCKVEGQHHSSLCSKRPPRDHGTAPQPLGYPNSNQFISTAAEPTQCNTITTTPYNTLFTPPKQTETLIPNPHTMQPPTTTQHKPENHVFSQVATDFNAKQVVLHTAKTKIRNKETNELTTVRVLLDCGSQRTFILNSLVHKLSLRNDETETLAVSAFAAEMPKVTQTKVVHFEMMLQTGQWLNIRANAMDKITGTMSREKLSFADIEVMKSIPSSQLADEYDNGKSFIPDILVGMDYFWSVICVPGCAVPTGVPVSMCLPSGLCLVSSKLGLVLGGHTKLIDSTSPTVASNTVHVGKIAVSTIPIAEQLEQFWQLETIGINDSMDISDDQQALELFKKTIEYNENRYYVGWPWKPESSALQDNYGLSLGRFRSLATKFQDDEEMFSKYSAVIKDQIAKGIIEKVPEIPNPLVKRHYLAHHPVITPHKETTKLRIVYDASAKCRKTDKSLNESMYRGPVILPNLCGLLLRFRTHKIAILGDIEKAFLQVGLLNDERDVTRFHWFKNDSLPVLDNNIQEFRFCRVPFGVVASPFLLGATIEHHLEVQGSNIGTKLSDDIYVDNLVTGSPTVDEAIQLYKETKSIFNQASMNMRDWVSNSKDFLSQIEPTDRSNAGNVVKVLGILWRITNDSILVTGAAMDSLKIANSKRSILHAVAAIYDPLGLIAPVIFPAKMFMQGLWKQGYGWDDKIPSDKLKTWIEIADSVDNCKELSIPRQISFSSECYSNTLMVFCDASAAAYGAAVYLRCKTDDHVSTALVFSKLRLAPCKRSTNWKPMTIPRLELLGTLIGCRAANFVRTQMKLNPIDVHIFTDSTCVLHWLTSMRPLKRFVENRIQEIQKSEGFKFHHVISKDNPADLLTRGTSLVEIKDNNLWWQGPDWLRLPQNQWPKGKAEMNMMNASDAADEARIPDAHLMYSTGAFYQMSEIPLIDFSRFSSLDRLYRSTVYVLRFLKKTTGTVLQGYMLSHRDSNLSTIFVKIKDQGPITAGEISAAKYMLELDIQRRSFTDVTDCIADNRPNACKDQLGVYIDTFGILRCRGRLINALDNEEECPKLIPKKHPYTTLLIRHFHGRLIHGSTRLTLCQLRREYWIPQGRSAVKSVIGRCAICRRYEGGSFRLPQMPPFPKERVNASTPFATIGIDYMGPLHVKVNHQTEKVWICLFTCLTIRAIHLEWVPTLSAEHFLNAFRRFTSRKAMPGLIISDNATNFRCGGTVIEKMWIRTMQDDGVLHYASSNGITWKYITEMAPWQGGFYERLIGITKRCLRKSIGRTLLPLEQLRTMIAEVEDIVNSRPLTYVYSDLNSAKVLTPNSFLKASNGKFEFPDMDENDEYVPHLSTGEQLVGLWKTQYKRLNDFWLFWKRDYLQNLRERPLVPHRSSKGQTLREPLPGDVVVVQDDGVKRSFWKLAIVTKVIRSDDQFARSATVQLPNGKSINRPLNMLYPLEISTSTDFPVHRYVNPTGDKSTIERPQRKAAIDAQRKIRELINEQVGIILNCRLPKCHDKHDENNK